MTSWRQQVFKRLRGPSAPRVLTTAMLLRLSERERPGVNESSVLALIRQGESFEFLRRVRSGIFLNLQADPTPQIAEAAQFIRRGAVVSLHSVLGDAGVINNPTPIVYSVLPILKDSPPPNVGEVRGVKAHFHYSALPERVLFAGDLEDRIDMNHLYPRATKEAALCHWVYLGDSRYSKMAMPPFDSDLDTLDEARLERLASAMGIKGPLYEWIDAIRQAEDEPDYDVNFGF